MAIEPKAPSEKQRKISFCGQSVPSGRSYAAISVLACKAGVILASECSLFS